MNKTIDILRGSKEFLTSGKLAGLLIIFGLVWFSAAFLIYPNFNVLYSTFFSQGSFSMAAIDKLASSGRALDSLKNSFILASTLIVTVNVVGIFIVLVTEYFEIKGAKYLRLGYFTTMIYSGIVLVTGYAFVYGSNGAMTTLLLQFFPGMDPNWFRGYFAVAFIMTFAITHFHLLFLSNAVRKIDYSTIEAARNMGASRVRILWQVVLPVLTPTIFAVSILVFLTGLNAFAAPIIVGGRDFQTANPMILTLVFSQTSRDIAALLAIILGLATILLVSLMKWVERGGNYISMSKVKSTMQKQKIHNPILNVVMHSLAYLLCAVYLTPITLVIIFSFTDMQSILTGTLAFDRFTLDNYINLFTNPNAYNPYITSILYASSATVLAVIICLIVARIVHKYKGFFVTLLEYTMMIPWLLPSTLIALGLIVTYDTPNPMVLNFVLLGTAGILLLGYTIERLPFSLRLLRSAFYSVDDSLEEAAKSMGAGTFYTFRKVIMPIILPATAAVAVLCFNHIISDYDLTIFLYQPSRETLGIAIFEATSSQGTFNQNARAMSLVYSVTLMIISATAVYLIYGRGGKMS